MDRSVVRRTFPLLAAACLACGGDGSPTQSGGDPPPTLTTMAVLGHGSVTDQYTSELSVRGAYAYTTTWGTRVEGIPGNTVRTWDVSGDVPREVSAHDVTGATTTGDVQVSDDGRLLVVAYERVGGGLAIYRLDDPAAPALVTLYKTPNTNPGVHTAEVARVDGTLYAFLSVDPLSSSGTPARLVVVDLTDPAAPREVLARALGDPFIHDVFVRDGILFTALWDGGLTIWDIGGAGRGGAPANPVQLGNVRTAGGLVHNVWWFHDPVSGARRYAFVGEEGPARLFTRASGDVHVVDVSDFTAPREVAFFHVDGAGTHNFSLDEASGILYAAYYNGGVRALDVRGDLGACTDAQRGSGGRCDLGLMGREIGRGLLDQGDVFVWGVHVAPPHVYASDMLNGLWKLRAVAR